MMAYAPLTPYRLFSAEPRRALAGAPPAVTRAAQVSTPHAPHLGSGDSRRCHPPRDSRCLPRRRYVSQRVGIPSCPGPLSVITSRDDQTGIAADSIEVFNHG